MADKRKDPATTDVEKQLKKLLADVDDMERKWFELPEEVRRASPKLARWFGDKPRSIN